MYLMLSCCPVCWSLLSFFGHSMCQCHNSAIKTQMASGLTGFFLGLDPNIWLYFDFLGRYLVFTFGFRYYFFVCVFTFCLFAVKNKNCQHILVLYLYFWKCNINICVDIYYLSMYPNPNTSKSQWGPLALENIKKIYNII